MLKEGQKLSEEELQVSLDQRTAKIYAVKVGVLKRISATQLESNRTLAALVLVSDDWINLKV